jgi:hypothetical protein
VATLVGLNKSNILNIKNIIISLSFDSYMPLLLGNFERYLKVPVVSRSILARLELF